MWYWNLLPDLSRSRLHSDGKRCRDGCIRELQEDGGVAHGREVGFEILN